MDKPQVGTRIYAGRTFQGDVIARVDHLGFFALIEDGHGPALEQWFYDDNSRNHLTYSLTYKRDCKCS